MLNPFYDGIVRNTLPSPWLRRHLLAVAAVAGAALGALGILLARCWVALLLAMGSAWVHASAVAWALRDLRGGRIAESGVDVRAAMYQAGATLLALVAIALLVRGLWFTIAGVAGPLPWVGRVAMAVRRGATRLLKALAVGVWAATAPLRLAARLVLVVASALGRGVRAAMAPLRLVAHLALSVASAVGRGCWRLAAGTARVLGAMAQVLAVAVGRPLAVAVRLLVAVARAASLLVRSVARAGAVFAVCVAFAGHWVLERAFRFVRPFVAGVASPLENGARWLAGGGWALAGRGTAAAAAALAAATGAARRGLALGALGASRFLRALAAGLVRSWWPELWSAGVFGVYLRPALALVRGIALGLMALVGWPLRAAARVAGALAHPVLWAGAAAGSAMGVTLHRIGRGLAGLAGGLWWLAGGPLRLGAAACLGALGAALWPLRITSLGLALAAQTVRRVLGALFAWATPRVAHLWRLIAGAAAAGFRHARGAVLWLGRRGLALLTGGVQAILQSGYIIATVVLVPALVLAPWVLGTGLVTGARLANAIWRARSVQGEQIAMSAFSRSQLLSLVTVIFVTGMAFNFAIPGVLEQPVVVTHWANGHMMNDPLLPTFAKQFNAQRLRTASGRRIQVEVHTVNSGVITCQLIARSNPSPCDDNEGTGGQHGDKLPNPTIVTPVSDQWLVHVNHMAGRTVADPATAKPLAKTYIGIVTEERMAECLGWPGRDIGVSDVLALRKDPRGWESCSTARAEWGKTPLISFTDPASSSTGRSMLMALYAAAAGKAPERLALADVTAPAAVRAVQDFQRAVDHYVPDTLILNSKIVLGPRYGHFYFLAEDNLVKLYQGKVKVTEGGTTRAKALERNLVFIHPKEGSPLHTHAAALVQAEWVGPEAAEAANRWTEFLRSDERQQAFMQEGFRPGTDIAYVKPAGSRFAPDPLRPALTFHPTNVPAPVAEIVAASWGEVKNSGVITFVLDISGSMTGKRIEEAKAGLVLALDTVHNRNLTGLITFASGIRDTVPVGPIAATKFRIQETVQRARVAGGTALYDAVKTAIRLTDEADAPADAIRGVVVLTDGQANEGQPLDQLIRVSHRSDDGRFLPACAGFDNQPACVDGAGQRHLLNELVGGQLAFPTRHRVHVFFVGIGEANFEVGRLLAEATGGAFRGAKEDELRAILEQFGKYF